MAEAKNMLEAKQRKEEEEEEQDKTDKEAEELRVLTHTPVSQLAPPQRQRLVDRDCCRGEDEKEEEEEAEEADEAELFTQQRVERCLIMASLPLVLVVQDRCARSSVPDAA